ncbi:MAG: hypothetical protein R3C70_07070 [Geminicoccaceae bacterium]
MSAVDRRTIVAGATAIALASPRTSASELTDPHLAWFEQLQALEHAWEEVGERTMPERQYDRMAHRYCRERHALCRLILGTPARTIAGIHRQVAVMREEYQIGKPIEREDFERVLTSLVKLGAH